MFDELLKRVIESNKIEEKFIWDKDLAQLTYEQRVAFAIYCVLDVTRDANFKAWAKDWLSGSETSRTSHSDLLAAALVIIAAQTAMGSGSSREGRAEAARQAAQAVTYAERISDNPERMFKNAMEGALKVKEVLSYNKVQREKGR